MPSIRCSINGYNLQKTLCDTGWQIRHYERLKVIIMGEDEYDPPIILGRLFLSTVKAIIYIGTREVHMHFPSKKVRRYFTDPNYIVEDS